MAAHARTRRRTARRIFAILLLPAVLALWVVLGSSGTLAWNNSGQNALNEMHEGRPSAPLLVTMTVQNRDGTALTDQQAHMPFTFTVTLRQKGGVEAAQPVGYTIYQSKTAPLNAGMIGWDPHDGIALEQGIIEGQRTFQLLHGQWLETDALPHGTLYQVSQTHERDYQFTGFLTEGAITAESARSDLLNVYAPVGIRLTKELISVTGDPLTADQLAQDFTFRVTFYRDGKEVVAPLPYQVEGAAPSEASHTEDNAPSSEIGVTESADPIEATETSETCADDALSGDETIFVAPAEAPDEAALPSSATSTTGTLVTLKAGQTASFMGLAAGTEFVVEEIDVPSEYGAYATVKCGTLHSSGSTDIVFTNVHGADPDALTGMMLVQETVYRLFGALTPTDRATRFAFDLSFIAPADQPFPEDTLFAYRVYRHQSDGEDDAAGPFVPETDEQGNQLTGTVPAHGGTIELSHGQVCVFDEMPTGTKWEVVEHPTDGYEQWFWRMEGQIFGGLAVRAPFQNEAVERMRTISGTKTWDLSAAMHASESYVPGHYLADTVRGLPTAASELLPEGITVRLVPTDPSLPTYEQTVFPDTQGRWTYSFEVPIFNDAGVEIDYENTYTLVEDEVPGFTSHVSGFDVHNVYVGTGSPETPPDPDTPNPPEDPEPEDPDKPAQPDDPQQPDDSSTTEPPSDGQSSASSAASNAQQAGGASTHPMAQTSDRGTPLAHTGDAAGVAALISVCTGALALVIALIAWCALKKRPHIRFRAARSATPVGSDTEDATW